jgi:6-phosphogluconate dehydrogenase
MPVSEQLSDVGVAGLCSAGCALVLRLAAAGLRVSLWDASAGALEAFVTLNVATRGGLVGYASSEDFFESLNTPRRIAVFETGPGLLVASLRPSLQEPDRLLEFPWREEPMAPGELDLLELTLVSQLA